MLPGTNNQQGHGCHPEAALTSSVEEMQISQESYGILKQKHGGPAQPQLGTGRKTHAPGPEQVHQIQPAGHRRSAVLSKRNILLLFISLNTPFINGKRLPLVWQVTCLGAISDCCCREKRGDGEPDSSPLTTLTALILQVPGPAATFPTAQHSEVALTHLLVGFCMSFFIQNHVSPPWDIFSLFPVNSYHYPKYYVVTER